MKLIERALKSAGRNYKVDSDLPHAFVYGEILRRGVDMARGIVTLRKMVFRGGGVRIRCKANLQLGPLAAIGAGSIVDASGRRGVKLARGAKIGRRSIVTTSSQMSKRGEGLEVGSSSGIGDYAHIGCSGGVVIGDDVIAGPFVTFHSQEHVTSDLERPIRDQGTREAQVIIADNVWIGARATFLAGSKVGTGCIVAAGSVVRGEFPPYSVIGGVPARILKNRSEQ